MNNLKVSDVKITEHNAMENKEIHKFADLMKTNSIVNPLALLPQTPWHVVEFKLSNTYSGFANGLRRVLMEELPVKCLTFEESDIETDDEFILIDVLLRSINSLPISQTVDGSDYEISLFVENFTTATMPIKGRDITIRLDKKNNSDITNLVPDPNITLINLRQGKTLNIKKITIDQGTAKQDAAKFSLLDNITYEILDMEPYDAVAQTGTRSVDYDPKMFNISFTTSGNIQPNQVVNLLCDVVHKKLDTAKENITKYEKYEEKAPIFKYYFSEELEVLKDNDIFTFKFFREYITLAYMLAQRCYLLDNTIPFCVPTINRYDDEIAIIRLKHPSPDKLLIAACNECIKDIEILRHELISNGKKKK
jgi:hypothetical protein